jgi:hypothetical protein
MQTLAEALAAGLCAVAMGACHDEPSKLDQLVEAGSYVPPPPEAAPAPEAREPTDATRVPTDASIWNGSMPPRPVPKPALTVNSGMPAETQMKAIAYMAAMGQPRFDDADADPDYAASLAAQLKPIAMSMDRGAAEEKLRLNRVDVVASGRRIDLLMADGCDARTAQLAVVGRSGVSFGTLLSHGVLVVRCNDAHVQCLQSTRDPSDVLCTTAPRHH